MCFHAFAFFTVTSNECIPRSFKTCILIGNFIGDYITTYFIGEFSDTPSETSRSCLLCLVEFDNLFSLFSITINRKDINFVRQGRCIGVCLRK